MVVWFGVLEVNCEFSVSDRLHRLLLLVWLFPYTPVGHITMLKIVESFPT